ncbi:MAG TPA: ATP-dependent Clp protease ATP-binding subunit [Patescibacteria group bacterium]|nr:ATP-dependent Clp protease ATP-binding subunit [Patescibacteria group bacterium]
MNGEQYTKLRLFYTSALMRTVRLLYFFLLIALLVSQLDNHNSIKLPLFFLIWYFIVEVFFRFHVYRYHPSLNLNKNKGNVLQSASSELLRVYLSSMNLHACLSHLYKYPQILFMLEKIGLTPKDMISVALEKEQVLTYSGEIVKTVRGAYITSMDFLTAYLLLTEEKTKLLFNHQLKKDELLQLLQWARSDFGSEEFPLPIRFNYNGEGIGEEIVSGWTLETQKYTTNFTYALGNYLPFLIGRETQYKIMLEALSRSEKNNCMLVGDPGVGKENLIAKLTDDSYYGLLSPTLNHKKVLELMVGPLIAGAQSRSDLEERLQAIIEEVAHSQNVLLYIPDFENLMGSTSFGIDVSGAIMPYLRKGELAIIASMTSGNFKTYLEHNPLQNVFTVIEVNEPDRETATQMLLAKSSTIEQANKVILLYTAITTAVELADRYDQDDVLPGSAVTLLSDTAHSVSLAKKKYVTAEDVEEEISLRANVNVGKPTTQEKDLLLHLEDKLHERIIDQVNAISAISEAIRRLRSGLTTASRPISFLFLGPTGVGKSETAKALADIYYGGENNMIRLDMSEYTSVDGERRLLGSAPGEGSERGELTEKIHDHPFSLVLLDEFEKASPRILDLFLQVLEDGRLTDNKGRTVSFVNCIIIATSNAGAEFIREKLVAGMQIDKTFQSQLLEYLQGNQIFKPELLNRFDDVVTFSPLGQKELTQIVQLLLKEIVKQMDKEDITITFDDKIVNKVVKEGADVEFGARPLRRYIQDKVEDLIAQKKLKDEIKRGDSLVMSVDAGNNVVLTG